MVDQATIQNKTGVIMVGLIITHRKTEETKEIIAILWILLMTIISRHFVDILEHFGYPTSENCLKIMESILSCVVAIYSVFSKNN